MWLFEAPWTVAHQVPLTTEFFRQEYWSVVPVPAPGDLPDPGILGLLHHYKQGLNPWMMDRCRSPFPPCIFQQEAWVRIPSPWSFLFPLFWWFSLLSRFSSWQVSSLWSSRWWPAVHRPCYDDGIVGCIFSVICLNLDGSFSFLEGLFFAFIF